MRETKRIGAPVIHQSNLIEGFDNEEMDAALAKAWISIKPAKTLDHAAIKRVQAIATKPQDIPDIWKGRYRSDIYSNNTRSPRVFVGAYEAPSPVMAKKLMDTWVLDYGDPTKVYDPIQAHIAFERIHPFMAGDGRTGCLLMWWYQKFNGLPFTYPTYAERWPYFSLWLYDEVI